MIILHSILSIFLLKWFFNFDNNTNYSTLYSADYLILKNLLIQNKV